MTTMFQNGNERRILNWSYPHPDFKPLLSIPGQQGFYGTAMYDDADTAIHTSLKRPTFLDGTKSFHKLPKNIKYSRVSQQQRLNV